MTPVARSQTSARAAGPADPARAVEDALTLLSTGRADMARTVLEPLPGLIRETRAAVEARAARLAAEVRELGSRVERHGRVITAMERRRVEEREHPARRGAGPRPPKPKPSQILGAALVSGRVDAARVAGLLRCDPGDVQALAEGRVGLPAWTWRRLLRAIANDIRHDEGPP